MKVFKLIFMLLLTAVFVSIVLCIVCYSENPNSEKLLRFFDLYARYGRYVICEGDPISEEYASKVLNDYISSFDKKYKGEASAVGFDLNDNGKREIIGISDISTNADNKEQILFILKKDNNNNYIMLPTNVKYSKGEKYGVLEHKTNGYHDLQVFDSNGEPTVKIKYQYRKGDFVYDYE